MSSPDTTFIRGPCEYLFQTPFGEDAFSAHAWLLIEQGKFMLMGHNKNHDNIGFFGGLVEYDRDNGPVGTMFREVFEEFPTIDEIALYSAVRDCMETGRYFRRTDSRGRNHWHFLLYLVPSYATKDSAEMLNKALAHYLSELTPEQQTLAGHECDRIQIVPVNQLKTAESRKSLGVRDVCYAPLDVAFEHQLLVL